MSEKGTIEYEVHVLKMSRYSSIPHTEDYEIEGLTTQSVNRFIMTDYFDSMVHLQLDSENKNYTKFLGMDETENGHHMADISSRIISLYSEKDDSGSDSIFCTAAKEKSLSAAPLIGVIQISLTPYFYHTRKEQATIGWQKELWPDIYKELEACCGDARHKIYHTLTSGELCLIIRSDSSETIYQIAVNIGQLICEGSNEFKYITYTCVGIQCELADDRRTFLTFSEDYVKQHSSEEFVMRFHVSRDICDLLLAVGRGNSNFHGLFGRYDFSLTLTMAQFARIYPSICRYKYRNSAESSASFDRAVGREKKEFLDFLIYGLECGKIQILNERPLIGLNGMKADERNTTDEMRTICRDVNDRNSKIYNRYEKLRQWRVRENIRGFQDVCRALGELVHSYSALGYELDSYSNWNIYNELLEILFDNIELYLNIMRLRQNDEKVLLAVERQFLQDLIQTVDAINQYTRFLQNVNQQTIQAPNYEIQTRIDAEKLVMAYTKYMERYMKQYREYDWSKVEESCREPRMVMYPIIFPDMTVEGTMVLSPFNNGKEQQLGNIDEAEMKGRRLILICKVPSFEYFGKLYQILPGVNHEISHHMLIMDRERRNEFVLRYLVSGVTRKILHMWVLQHSSEGGIYMESGIEQSISEVITNYYIELINEYLNLRGITGHNCKVNVLLTGIKSFFSGLGSDFSDSFRSVISEKEKRELLAGYFRQYAYEMCDEKLKALIKGYMETAGGGADGGNKCQEAEDIIKRIYDDITESYARVCEKWMPSVKKTKAGLVCRIGGQEPISIVDVRDSRIMLEKKIKAFVERVMEACNPQKQCYVLPLVKDYCYQLLQVNHLYYLCQRDTQDEVRVEENKIEEIQKKYLQQLRENIQNYRNGQKLSSYICDQETMQIINEMEIDVRDHMKFYSVWGEHVKQIAPDVLCQWVERAWYIYRETCADIIMCRTTGFTMFGYLRFVAGSILNLGVPLEVYGENSQNMERIRLVLAVLHDQGIGSQTFAKDIQEYIHQEIMHIGNAVLQWMEHEYIRTNKKGINDKLKKILIGLASKFSKQILGIWKKTGKNGRCSLIWEAAKEFEQNLQIKTMKDGRWERYVQPALKRYQYLWERMMILLYLAEVLADGERLCVDKYSKTHMECLYKLISNQNKAELCCWQGLEDNHYSKCRVTQYYNDPIIAAKLGKDKMLDDTIQFVEDYYYLERLERERRVE